MDSCMCVNDTEFLRIGTCFIHRLLLVEEAGGCEGEETRHEYLI